MEAVKTSEVYIEIMYTGCLAEAAYYIESEGEVAIIDPMRETQPYIDLAQERGAKIKYIFETHFHADFVSGHFDLSERTGASIIYGPKGVTSFDSIVAEDGQEFTLGTYTFKVLHTPGHTMESSCFLLSDETGKPHAVFTGDTLFIGEVGRPDLAQKGSLTMQDLAGFMYDSIREKLMTLPDEVIVYPAHGAGSACGKNISDERMSTIGLQKDLNYALQPMSKAEFVEKVTDGIQPPPQYFPKNAMLNKQGYRNIDELLKESTLPLSIEQVKKELAGGSIIIDTRTKDEFVKGHIPASYFIGLDGSFAPWVGTLIVDLDQKIIVVTTPGREEEAILRLARVGYNHAIGYVDGGVAAWKKAGEPIGTLKAVSPETFAGIHQTAHPSVIDVRKESEYGGGHVKGAKLYTLDFINDHLNDLDKNTEYHLYCRSGYRSVLAASVLMRQGYDKLVNVEEGFMEIEKTEIEIE